MFCLKCGREINNSVKFCPYCGTPITEEETVVVKKAPLTKPKKKTGLIVGLIIASVLLLLLLAGVGFGAWYLYDSYGTLDLGYIFGDDEITAIRKQDDTDETDIPEPETEPETSAPETKAPETEAETEPEEPADPVLYFIMNSDSRYFSYDDISGFDADDCRIARNGIYARHGRKFKDSALTQYFLQYDWYYPIYEADSFNEGLLNSIEKSNVELIVSFEEYMGYR